MKDKTYNRMKRIPAPRVVSDVPKDDTITKDREAYRNYLNEVAALEVGEGKRSKDE